MAALAEAASVKFPKSVALDEKVTMSIETSLLMLK